MVTLLVLALIFMWAMGLILLVILLANDDQPILGWLAVTFVLLWPFVVFAAIVASVLPARWQDRLQAWLRREDL